MPISLPRRALAVVAPVLAVVLGAAMAVQWELGAGGTFADGAPGAATVGPWLADTLPLLDASGDPSWWWRGPFFLCLVAALPFVWAATGRVPATAARWSTRVGFVVAAGAIALEYSSPGYGWIVDLSALLVAIGGTLACGISVLRHGVLPRPAAWALVGVLPLTFAGGFLVLWYLPPGLTVGLLLAWAIAALLAGAGPPAGSADPSPAGR